MTEKFLRFADFMFHVSFGLHDMLSSFFARHILGIKRTILIVAHISLLGFLFPEIRKDLGSIALFLLFFILFLSPVSKILRTRLLLQMMSVRRELGISMAYIATVHGVGYLFDPLWYSQYVAPQIGTSMFTIDPRYFFGIAAYGLTLPLLLTSNNLAIKFLGASLWKKLHRIVYVLFFVVLLHYFLKTGKADSIQYGIGLLVFSFYVFIKVLAWKNFIEPLRKIIDAVAERYKVYVTSGQSKPASLESGLNY